MHKLRLLQQRPKDRGSCTFTSVSAIMAYYCKASTRAILTCFAFSLKVRPAQSSSSSARLRLRGHVQARAGSFSQLLPGKSGAERSGITAKIVECTKSNKREARNLWTKDASRPVAGARQRKRVACQGATKDVRMSCASGSGCFSRACNLAVLSISTSASLFADSGLQVQARSAVSSSADSEVTTDATFRPCEFSVWSVRVHPE